MNTELIEKYDMLPAGASVLCAVSGGADSMCLLHWLWSNAADMGITVCAAHYDHQLRGLESARDRTFVKDFCREHGIALEVGFGHVREYAEKNGMGIEEAARALRYEFLNSAAAKLGCTRIATAHNADDNAETVLFNLARGAGAAGLRGIPPVRDNIIRPLLGTPRSEIISYLAENGLSHVEDSSNSSDDYSRNTIRHNVMPVLRGINPAFSESVLRTSELLRADEEYFMSAAEAFILENGEDDRLPAAKILELPKPVAARVFRRMCGRALGSEHCQAIYKLLSCDGAACADIPGMRVRIDRGSLCFGGERAPAMEDREVVPGEKFPVYGAGLEISADIIQNCKEIHSSFKTFYFKYASICDNIFCTRRRDGDRIRLAGRGCTKSIKALFNESKMTQSQKDLTPVIRDGKGVIGVYGFGIAERCVPAPGDTVLRINIENI